MPIERDDDNERRARIDVLIEECGRLRQRAAAARRDAQDAIERAKELLHREEVRVQREHLVESATAALKTAKAESPRVERFDKHRRRA